jgi:hypothetical protein
MRARRRLSRAQLRRPIPCMLRQRSSEPTISTYVLAVILREVLTTCLNAILVMLCKSPETKQRPFNDLTAVIDLHSLRCHIRHIARSDIKKTNSRKRPAHTIPVSHSPRAQDYLLALLPRLLPKTDSLGLKGSSPPLPLTIPFILS